MSTILGGGAGQSRWEAFLGENAFSSRLGSFSSRRELLAGTTAHLGPLKPPSMQTRLGPAPCHQHEPVTLGVMFGGGSGPH